MRSNAVDIICVDSVAALVPRAEIEGEMGAHQGGEHQVHPTSDCLMLSSRFCVQITRSEQICWSQDRQYISYIYLLSQQSCRVLYVTEVLASACFSCMSDFTVYVIVTHKHGNGFVCASNSKCELTS